MAMRQQDLRSKAVERARDLFPGQMPDSLALVQLTREDGFVVVRSLPDGLFVLDRAGRLVRGRARLRAVAAHVEAVASFEEAIAASHLERRREHVERSVPLLTEALQGLPPTVAERTRAVIETLSTLAAAIDGTLAEIGRHATALPTERTLPRAESLLIVAAAADRAVVRAVRLLGHAVVSLRPAPQGLGSEPIDRVLRWVLARLASDDLPYLLPPDADTARDARVASFVAAATRRA
jgi:hypothetical protein